MKKIVQQLLIIALFFTPFVSSARISPNSPVTAFPEIESALLRSNIEQFPNYLPNGNTTFPEILADFKYTTVPTTNCSAIPTIDVPPPFGLDVASAPTTSDAGFYNIEVEKNITGLKPGTTYYACLYATEGATTNPLVYSRVETFRTKPKVTLTASQTTLPSGGNSVLTWVVEGAVSCSATGGTGGWAGSKNKDGGSQNINDIRVRTTFTITCTNGFNYGNTIANVQININETAETNNLGVVRTYPFPGATETIDGKVVRLEPEKALKVTDTSAELQGIMFKTNAPVEQDAENHGYFRISKVDIPPIFCNDIFGSNMISVISDKPNKNGQIQPDVRFSKIITNLEPDTEYAYCAIVSNKATRPSEIKYGQVVTFRTNPCVTCPHTTIRTLNPASIGTNSAILQGSYNSTRKIKTWFEYKEKGLNAVETPATPLEDGAMLESGKKLAFSHILGSSLLESIKIGTNILNTQINTIVNAAIPEWKKTPTVSYLGVRNYGRMNYTLTGLRKDTVYQYRAVGQTITDTTRPNPNPIQTFYGNTLEFRTRIYGDNQDVLAHCFNGVQDFGETGVDTGGGCPSKAPNCFDNIKNGNETGVDEGGSCGLPSHCYNGVQDEDLGETGIDNGGPCGTRPVPTCPSGTTGTYPNCVPSTACPGGTTGTPPNCIPVNQNCPSGTTGTFPNCIPTNCYNGIQDGNETGVDEGPGCPAVPANCYNGIQDGNETGVDEGPSCPKPSCPFGFTGTPPECTPTKKVTADITANPLFVLKGGNTSVNWTSTNATSCTVSGPVIGGKTGLNGGFGFGIPNIQANTTWSVNCIGETGSASDSVTVSILRPGGTGGSGLCPLGYTGTAPDCVPTKKVTADITANPLFVLKGGNTSVNWTSTNATSCTVSGPVIGGKTGLNGGFGFGIPNIQANTTWSVNCIGETGSASDSVTVSILRTGGPGGQNGSCPFGFTGTLPNCVASGVCPTGTSGIFPNCKFDQQCPSGTTGTFPNCNFSACEAGAVCVCPTNYTGTYPNCRPPIICPSGMTGTYPNCIFDRECPIGYEGTYPSCTRTTTCPVGAPGVYPNCYSNGPLPAHCYNGVQDFDETGLDSGGSCTTGGPTGPQPTCPTGFTGTPPTCVGPTSCPTGTTGTYPNCTFVNLTSCPTGSAGTYPNCIFTTPTSCPTGTTGTYPNCLIVDGGPNSCGDGFNFVPPNRCVPINKCPLNSTGTYPNCNFTTPTSCPPGSTGTYPICRFTSTCPVGFSGTYPLCTSISTNPTAHCTNGIQDFGETSIDRGGGCGGVYVNNPTCFDNTQNGGETGVDTGGHCGDGPNNNGQYPSCFDGVKNGSETGIDIGGHCGNTNNGFDWIDFIFPDYTGTGTGAGNCVNGTCTGTFTFNYPGYTGPINGNWIAGGNTGTYTGNCVAGVCTGTFTGTIPGLNGPFTGTFTGGLGDGSNNPNYDWTDMTFPGFSGTGNTNGSCTNGICTGSWNGVMPGYNGPVVGIWSSPDGTGPFTGTCTATGCTGSWTGVLPGYNGPNNGNWTGGNGNGSNGNENNQNWIDISFDGTDGTGTFTGTCTISGCSGEWTGLVPGHNGPITGTWSGPNGTGTFTGTCVNGVCTGTWTGGSGDVGPISGTWNGGNDNNPGSMIYNNTNGTGTFNGACTNTTCSGNWTGIVPGVTGNISDTWTGPNGTGTFTGTCTATSGCTGTWTGGSGDVGPIYGTWDGGEGNTNNITTITLDEVDGTGTFTGNCTTKTKCGGNWEGGTGATGPVKGTWEGPNGTGTFTGNCTTTGCTGSWNGGQGNVGPISGVWNGGKGNGNIPANMTFQGTDGTGTFTGTCTTSSCSGEWDGILPNSQGKVAGKWTGPTGTGDFIGTCTNNVCNGSWTGGKGDEGVIYGPWDGDNKNNPATMKFDGTDGTGTFNGTCDKQTCKGTWDGLVPGHNGPINGKWTGPHGTGTFSGTCENGVCTGTWTGGKGDEGVIYGTWDGTNGNGNGNELYLGYEGTPDVDDIVRYHEGVEHVFIRRIMINTELARKYGYKKGDNLLYFAWDLAHKFSKEFGYVDGQGREIRVNLPDVSAYQLRQVGNKLTVYEYYKNKIIDIRDTTTVFKDKNSYEYYFQKN